MSNKRTYGGALLALVLAVTGCGSEPSADEPNEAMRARLGELGEVQRIEATPVNGVYAVKLGGRWVHVAGEGRYVLDGDMYRAADKVNLTEVQRVRERKQLLAELDRSSAIVFEAKGNTSEAREVFVFTDITCTYCQHFHEQIDAYNERGITVNYFSFPRGGPGSLGWKLAETVWCADDPRQAITQAKADPENYRVGEACADADIATQHELGGKLGLRGTPMIIDTDGRIHGGFVPPERLASALEQPA